MLTYVEKNVPSTSKEDDMQNKKHTLKILSVDDDEMNQLLFTSLLSKLGYTCATAKNGKQAVDMVLKEEFDIIFMDIYMPIMDGIEATFQIRNALKTKQKPIIVALSANNFDDEKQKCTVAGMNDFMQKPYRLVTMEELLDKWNKELQKN